MMYVKVKGNTVIGGLQSWPDKLGMTIITSDHVRHFIASYVDASCADAALETAYQAVVNEY